jgi:imidazolonepropionase-like amidohydrolase
MPGLRRLAGMMRRAGVWNCPTAFHVEGDNLTMADVPTLRYLRVKLQKPVLKQALDIIERQRGVNKPNLPSLPEFERWVDRQRKEIKVLHDSGVGLLLGTDNGGFAVPWELEVLVRVGLTPYEALATGTRNVAVFLGTLDSTGTVAVGKRADLVLLAGNPLTDIRHTAYPAGVMLGGRWLSRAELDQVLALLEDTLDS